MRRWVTFVVLTTLTVSAACSQGGNDGGVAVRAVNATEASRTFRMEGTSHTSSDSSSPDVTSESHVTGEVDVARSRLHLNSVDKASDDGSSTDFEIVVIGGDSWVKVGPDGASPRPWSHTNGGSSQSMLAIDPSALLHELQAHGARLMALGADDVRGVSTTHYRVSDLDPTRATTKDFKVMSISMDVWIDPSDLVRRIEQTMDVTTSANRRVEHTRGVVEFFDFGAAIDIQPPPPSQVSEQADSDGATASTSANPSSLGNELVTFQAVSATSAPPCEQPALTNRDGSACLTVGDTQWTRPVLESADAESQNGNWIVRLVLTEPSIKQFNEIAATCAARAPRCATGMVAVILNDEVLSSPVIETPSFQRDQIQISGFTEHDAKELARRVT